MTEEKITRKLNGAFGLQLVDREGAIIPIDNLPVSIGRGDQNEIRIEDETISKSHAQIFYHKSAHAVCIEDLESNNGVYVNNKPTKKNVLEDGFEIRLGAVSFTFRDTGYMPPI